MSFLAVWILWWCYQFSDRTLNFLPVIWIFGLCQVSGSFSNLRLVFIAFHLRFVSGVFFGSVSNFRTHSIFWHIKFSDAFNFLTHSIFGRIQFSDTFNFLTHSIFGRIQFSDTFNFLTHSIFGRIQFSDTFNFLTHSIFGRIQFSDTINYFRLLLFLALAWWLRDTR